MGLCVLYVFLCVCVFAFVLYLGYVMVSLTVYLLLCVFCIVDELFFCFLTNYVTFSCDFVGFGGRLFCVWVYFKFHAILGERIFLFIYFLITYWGLPQPQHVHPI